jgi:hypothetical protein
MPAAKTAKKTKSTKTSASKKASAKKTSSKKTSTKKASKKQAAAKKSTKKAVRKSAANKAGGAGATTPEHDRRVAEMVFSSVYPHYVVKVTKKGRTEAELHEVLRWLTGYTQKQLERHFAGKTTFEAFFAKAKLNPKAEQITGTICGYRIEDITTPLTRNVRYLDKLVDELAKGRAMEKVLREG